MTDAAHTPGPWRISNVGLNDDGCFRHQIGTYEKTVAYTWVPNEHNSPENEANASLIAAAPALLSALEDCLVAINPSDKGGISMEIWNKRLKAASANARAAITAAKGE